MTKRLPVTKRPPTNPDASHDTPGEIRVALPGAPEILRFRESVRLGRGEHNAIVLQHEVVSNEHFELLRTSDGWEIVDLGSTNGTYVDNKLVTRAQLGAHTTVTLGAGGPEIHLTIPALGSPSGTREMPTPAFLDRIFADEAPADMSPHTALMRAALHNRLGYEAMRWVRRQRHLRVALVLVALVAAGAGGMAFWQARRVAALREVAGTMFNTMKSLDLDLRRLQAIAGPDSSIQEQRTRLEAQYDDLIRTLGIYSASTPADVQLIYRTIHRLGESEANVPRGFINEVRRYIGLWKSADLRASVARAEELRLAPQIAAILSEHHLPREFFFLHFRKVNWTRVQSARPRDSASPRASGSLSHQRQRRTGCASAHFRVNVCTTLLTSATTRQRQRQRPRDTSATCTTPMPRLRAFSSLPRTTWVKRACDV